MTLADAVTVWLMAPLSLHDAKVNWVPGADCGEVVAMVCCEPTVQLTETGATCGGPPSTVTDNPVGRVSITVLGPACVTLKGLLVPMIASGEVSGAGGGIAVIGKVD